MRNQRSARPHSRPWARGNLCAQQWRQPALVNGTEAAGALPGPSTDANATPGPQGKCPESSPSHPVCKGASEGRGGGPSSFVPHFGKEKHAGRSHSFKTCLLNARFSLRCQREAEGRRGPNPGSENLSPMPGLAPPNARTPTPCRGSRERGPGCKSCCTLPGHPAVSIHLICKKETAGETLTEAHARGCVGASGQSGLTPHLAPLPPPAPTPTPRTRGPGERLRSNPKPKAIKGPTLSPGP